MIYDFSENIHFLYIIIIQQTKLCTVFLKHNVTRLKMNEDQTGLNTITAAAGDGYVNGTSMPMNNILRVRILVFGHGAGDPGVIHMIVNRRRPRMIDVGVTTSNVTNSVLLAATSWYEQMFRPRMPIIYI